VRRRAVPAKQPGVFLGGFIELARLNELRFAHFLFWNAAERGARCIQNMQGLNHQRTSVNFNLTLSAYKIKPCESASGAISKTPSLGMMIALSLQKSCIYKVSAIRLGGRFESRCLVPQYFN